MRICRALMMSSRRDRDGAVGDDDLGELAGERVDQPRLALGLVEGGRQRVRGEALAGIIGVLLVELGDLVER
jgi:hypothetical protein